MKAKAKNPTTRPGKDVKVRSAVKAGVDAMLPVEPVERHDPQHNLKVRSGTRAGTTPVRVRSDVKAGLVSEAVEDGSTQQHHFTRSLAAASQKRSSR